MSSTVYGQDIVDDALRFGDIRPVLSSGGSSLQPALTIMNQVMTELCSVRYNWKWNSFLLPVFQTISWQNDYAQYGLTNLAYLENGIIIDINSSSIPKRKFKLEIVKDLQSTADSYGRPFQCCWMNNVNMLYGTWGSGATVPNVNNTGQTNPGPNVVYTNPLGSTTTPSNPTTQIIDPNGNIQVVQWIGVLPGATLTCGSVPPTWPPASSAAGTLTTDGQVTWVVVDPTGQGLRLQMIPAQAGNVWQVILRGQKKPVRFTSLGVTIDPVPDDFSSYFMQGFRAYCYQRSPEAKIRAKFDVEFKLWIENLQQAEGQADREQESFVFYPADNFTGGCWDMPWPGPSWPYAPPY
jgi:hypothetical protein